MTMVIWDNNYLIDNARNRYADWRKAADQGDAVGQFFVGYCYQHGLTVPEDPQAAFGWFMKSAQQKNTDAMIEVAMCSASGIGTAQNPLEFAHWMKDAVDAGNASAMVGWGVALFSFPVSPGDKELGKQWMIKGQDAGSADGIFWVGLSNVDNPAFASAQVLRAAAAGQPDALYALAETNPADLQRRQKVQQALKTMGNPSLIARIIDPTLPGGFYHQNLFPDLAVERLRGMAASGSAEASRLLATLKQSGKITN